MNEFGLAIITPKEKARYEAEMENQHNQAIAEQEKAEFEATQSECKFLEEKIAYYEGEIEKLREQILNIKNRNL